MTPQFSTFFRRLQISLSTGSLKAFLPKLRPSEIQQKNNKRSRKRYEALRYERSVTLHFCFEKTGGPLWSVTVRAKRSVTLRYTFVLRKHGGTATKRYATSEALRYVTLHFCFEKTWGDRYEALQYERSVTLRYVTLLFWYKLRNVRKLRFLIFQQNEREGKERRWKEKEQKTKKLTNYYI